MEEGIQLVAMSSLRHWDLTLPHGTTNADPIVRLLAERYGSGKTTYPTPIPSTASSPKTANRGTRAADGAVRRSGRKRPGGLASAIIGAVPEDLDADGQGGNLLDDGLSDVPGRKRIAELPMLASLYLQALGPMGTTGPGATGFVLRDAGLAPCLITNRHVVTGQNTLNGLKVPADTLPVSALRVAVHKAGPSARGCPSRCGWAMTRASRTGWSTQSTGHG